MVLPPASGIYGQYKGALLVGIGIATPKYCYKRLE